MALNIKTSAENEWLIKRLAISCCFFFSVTDRQRHFMQTRINVAVDVNTAEALRSALKIQPRAWSAFMDEFFKQGGVIRRFNAKAHYGEVQSDRPEAEAFKGQPLYGDKNFEAMMERLKQEQKTEKREKLADGAEGLQAEGDDATDANDAEVEAALANVKAELAKEKAELAKEKARADRAEAATGDRVLHIELKTPASPDFKRLAMVHKTTPDLLVRINCGLNVYLVGPAGSGKTTAAEKVSEALGLQFGFMSVGPQTTKSDVFGYMSASGDYIATEFRRRFEQGGVFLFDEIDAAHPGVLTQINAALAGSSCAFPDKMVKKHADFRCIAAGNTYGTGPDRVYVGRQELDGASLDRFDFVEWAYDEALEREIALTLTTDREIALRWTSYIQAVRKAIAKLGIRHIVSPRATMNGVKLLTAGVSETKVRETSVYKSLKPDEVKRIEAQLLVAA